MNSKSPILERRFYPEGKLIVEEGDEAFVAYIIQSGVVSVFSEKDGKKIEFTKLEAGEIFGESALIQDITRTASVEAMTDCNLITITRDSFQDKINNSDPTIRAVIKMLSNRVNHSNTELLKTKGVNVDNFIQLLNQLFRDLSDAMPEDDKAKFKNDSFPVMKEMINVIEQYRDKLV
jgi:CRP-like cAMP-binding protein